VVLDIIVEKSDDGCTAEVPSLKGCECWAHDEDTAIDKVVDLASYYLKTDKKEFKLDRARSTRNKIIYKLIFNKK
jgi:hypothetical protein